MPKHLERAENEELLIRLSNQIASLGLSCPIIDESVCDLDECSNIYIGSLIMLGFELIEHTMVINRVQTESLIAIARECLSPSNALFHRTSDGFKAICREYVEYVGQQSRVENEVVAASQVSLPNDTNKSFVSEGP